MCEKVKKNIKCALVAVSKMPSNLIKLPKKFRDIKKYLLQHIEWFEKELKKKSLVIAF